MLLTLKDLQQKTWTVEISPSQTVLELKQINSKLRGWTVGEQKLIFSGRILSNEKSLEASNVNEQGYIVCMVPKAQKTEPPKPVQEAEIPATDPDFQKFVEMGFPPLAVAKAMRAAPNNPDLAAEYLFNGIPENLQNVTPDPPASVPSPDSSNTPPIPTIPPNASTDPIPPSASTAPTELEIQLQRLAPVINQVRQMVAQNPEMLPTLLQQLLVSNPDLARIVENDPQALSAILLKEPQYIQLDDAQGGPDGPVPDKIQVTQEEKEAIERLIGLGLDRNLVIKTYFALDKNEINTANYLFNFGNIS